MGSRARLAMSEAMMSRDFLERMGEPMARLRAAARRARRVKCIVVVVGGWDWGDWVIVGLDGVFEGGFLLLAGVMAE